MGAIVAGRSVWHIAAAISGAAAVGMGAYGAHAFKPKNPHYKEVMDRGTQYHLIHTALIALAPMARKPNIVGGLATAGVLLFSGSCYAAALTETRSNGRLAPVGGFSFIFAWLALAL